MTSHELARKLLEGPDLATYMPLRNSNPNLEEIEEVEHAITYTHILLCGSSHNEWIKNMYEVWGKEKVLF